jgi:predicted ATPase/class 3 adenylate cyclase
MRELPTGTVTLLFSDIEGSTALLSRLGDRYGAALSAQRELMRVAISASGGLEMGTEGDSFYVAFESAAAAVRACVAAQRALAGYEWPGGAAVRVRMGLHSGEPARHEDGYVGMDVHRAARIAAAGHGGQVVLSDATRLLAQPRLPDGVSVRDLGWHRLKDIDAPERIYQLVIPGLPDQFPPPKSLGAQTSLPAPLTPLVSRDSELEQLRAAILRPQVRLVTLTGTGGVGKTRLAMAAAASLTEAFEHGIYFIALAAVRDAEVMWKTIAASLHVSGDEPAAVTEYLQDRLVLLVLDNLEQLAGASEVVAGLLATAPGLVVLATSRRPLHLLGEYEQPVSPLEVPTEPGAAEVAACGAARLFVQQAAMVRPNFTITEANAADVAAICRRLDGLPLAIELAASRARLLPPRALLARLGDSLGLAAGAAVRPSRQQTLQNTIAWSYELLTPDLAGVFRRIGVFADGCDLDALAAVALAADEQVAGTDPLQPVAALLDLSLVTVAEGADGEPRVSMLETIRQYALDQLERSGNLDDVRRRHAAYFASFAERAHDQLTGPAQLASLDSLEAEHDNLRAALAWSLDTGATSQSAAHQSASDERAVIGLRLVQALSLFWYRHGHATEGRRWLEQAVRLASDQAGAPHARMAHWLGVLMQQQGELHITSASRTPARAMK